MTVESANDRLAFLNDFGVDCVFNRKNFKGIFDNAFNELTPGGNVSFSIQEAQLHCRTSDIVTVEIGSTVKVDGSNFIVQDKQPDGTGMTVLMLERQ